MVQYAVHRPREEASGTTLLQTLTGLRAVKHQTLVCGTMSAPSILYIFFPLFTQYIASGPCFLSKL